jgi:hypothetical protein
MQRMRAAAGGSSFAIGHWSLVILIGAWFAFFFGGSASAQSIERPEFVGIRVGFADQYKIGLWTPVEVTIRGGSEPLTGRITLTVPDNDSVPCVVSTPEAVCQLLPGQTTSVTLYARFGRGSDTVKAAFCVGPKVAASKEFEEAGEADGQHFCEGLQGKGLILQVGGGTMGLEDLAAIKIEGQPRTVVARLGDVARLPTRWYGYEGVDAVVLSTSRLDVFDRLTPENARIEALEEWIRRGGTLLLCVGSQGDQVLHEGSVLARFAPGKLREMVSLHQTGGLETYAKSTSPIPGPKPGQPVNVRVPRLAGVEGRTEAAEADLPLVIRSPRGLGQVIFLAADLDRPPVSLWSDRRLLVGRLLDLPTDAQPVKDTNALADVYGYNDLAGQLHSSLDQFADVQFVPFYVVVLLVLVYILLIGPGDYFFLRRVLRRMEWTWVTFPAIVVLFGAGAYVAAYKLKGSQLRINQVDLVDVDTSGTLYGTTWCNIFSPRMDTFDLSLRPRRPDGQAAEGGQATMGWFGMPGAGMGGMYQRGSQAGTSLWSGHYAFSPTLDAMEGVPIQVWSTKSLTGRWSAPSPGGCIASKLVDDARLPSGSITNNLPYPLTPCFLVYDHWVYEIGRLGAGATFEIASGTRRVDLQTYMSSRYSDRVASGAQQRHGPIRVKNDYDSSSREAIYVLETMMFYGLAGGAHYSDLTNDYQRFTDRSGLLKAGRAVLVGVAPEDGLHYGAELLREGRPIGGPKDPHMTVFRFVLPVTVVR